MRFLQIPKFWNITPVDILKLVTTPGFASLSWCLWMFQYFHLDAFEDHPGHQEKYSRTIHDWPKIFICEINHWPLVGHTGLVQWWQMGLGWFYKMWFFKSDLLKCAVANSCGCCCIKDWIVLFKTYWEKRKLYVQMF